MKKIFTLCAFLCAAITAGNAGEIVLCDFENYNVGDAFTMVNIYGPTTSTAEVVADPLNPDNKVLHVKVDNWNTFVQFVLPEGITGKNLLDNYQKVSFDLYRAADQTNDYMQTAVLLGPSTDGSTTLYWDSDYPFLGDKGKWIPKSYDFNRIYNESTTLLLGLHCDVVEYYIDNVRLSGVSSVETDTIRWTASVSNVWDAATTNFSALEDDPATGTPVAFASGNRVIFDDNVLTTATATPTTVQVSGTMEASTVVFDNTELDYTLTAADGEAALTGAGQFIVQGGGSVTVGVNNQFLKGTYLKDGELRMGVQNGNVLGTSLLTEGGTLYTCFDNSSDSYVSVSTPMTMAEGTALDVYLSRYAYWMSSLSGNGTLNIYAGGERSYLGNEKGAKYPDWNGFSGTVNVYPYKEVVSTAGFYGVILGHGGKTFNPAEIEESLSSGKVNTMFENSVLVLHDGTALACESGTRAFRIGELQMSPTSRIYGYFKASSPVPTLNSPDRLPLPRKTENRISNKP